MPLLVRSISLSLLGFLAFELSESQAADGLVSDKSRYSAKETMDRLLPISTR